MNRGLDHPRMVINMDEAKLRTIAQLQELLDATLKISFTGTPGNNNSQRCEHISRVLKRFGYAFLCWMVLVPEVPT
jgi:hypothetical protein